MRQKSSPGHHNSPNDAASRRGWRNSLTLLDRISIRNDFVAEKLSNYTVDDNGCWNYQGQTNEGGYGKFKIYVRLARPQKLNVMAHRVSYAVHYGIDPGELCVCHHCDNPCCINPDHLFLGTDADNTQDRIDKGRSANQRGARNGNARMTESMVLDVVELIKQGKTNKAIARDLPVSHAQVSLIRLGKSWRHITEAANYNPDDYRNFTRKAS